MEICEFKNLDLFAKCVILDGINVFRNALRNYSLAMSQDFFRDL